MPKESKKIQVTLGSIEGVHVWQVPTHPDLRGRLFKVYTEGPTPSFPVEFQTFEHFFTKSNEGVFRGMHFQGAPHAATKVISIVQGEAIDFLLDTRRDSKTFAHLFLQELNETNPVSIYIPEGVAHGYISLKEGTIISYRQSVAFCENCDGGISGGIVEKFLPILLSKTIRSERDIKLPDFANFSYLSKCIQ